MLLDADDCQLILVDFQTKLMPVIFENERVIANAVRLARMAQALQVPIWGTAQMPDKLGPTVPDLLTAIESAGGKTLAKTHFSAIAEGLGDYLRPPARKPAMGSNARSLPKHLQKAAPKLQSLAPANQARFAAGKCAPRSLQ